MGRTLGFFPPTGDVAISSPIDQATVGSYIHYWLQETGCSIAEYFANTYVESDEVF